jgi:pimeloyl-ACP methyl ester carboxylesterase
MPAQPRPFVVDIPQVQLSDLKSRLAATRYPEQETVTDWQQGIPLAYVREIASHWHTHYDWRSCEARLNAWPNFLVEIDGLDVHFMHARSANPHARPLLLTHGWPGSVLEFMNVIRPLLEDFHLVIPSLPGYGFSGKPTKPGWSVEQIALAWNQLMLTLGYRRYFAQGGDWGATVTCALGVQNLGNCAGIHLNMVIGRPAATRPQELTDVEAAIVARLKWYRDTDSSYALQQATRPQTLGYALADSPVGQLAWILEKFHGWSDCDGHPENVFSRDQLLDNVTLYWLTNSAASSARLYWQSFRKVNTDEIRIPTGCSLFPMELMRLSRRWAEDRYKNIVYWNELPRGGHFAAMERPEVFVQELRACFGAMQL